MNIRAGTAEQGVSQGSNRDHEPLSLRALRHERDVKIRELEAATGIHRGRLSELERGLRWPSRRELELLDEFYGVSLRVAWVIQVEDVAA